MPNEKEPTSERLVAKENKELLKNVKPQEVYSLVQTSKSDDPVSGNRLRECLQKFETQEKSVPFTVCGDASFWKRVSVGMCYKTIANEDAGFGDRTQHAENTHIVVQIQIPEFMPQFQDQL